MTDEQHNFAAITPELCLQLVSLQQLLSLFTQQPREYTMLIAPSTSLFMMEMKLEDPDADNGVLTFTFDVKQKAVKLLSAKSLTNATKQDSIDTNELQMLLTMPPQQDNNTEDM